MDTIKKFSDENLIAYLVYKTYQQAAPPAMESNIPYWYFLSTPELDKELIRYMSGEVLVNPIVYGKSLRYVRRVNASMRYKGVK